MQKYCKECSKTFETKYTQKNYCNIDCAKESNRKLSRIYYRNNYKAKETVNKRCKECNNTFYTNYSRNIYCSADCFYEFACKTSLAKYYSKRVLKKEKRPCKICNQLFDWEGRKHKTNVCSDKCRAKNDSINNCKYAKNRTARRTEEENKAFVESRRKYMRDWRAKKNEMQANW